MNKDQRMEDEQEETACQSVQTVSGITYNVEHKNNHPTNITCNCITQSKLCDNSTI